MLNNVKVGTKLIAGFLSVAVIAAIIGFMGINSANKLDFLIDELYNINVSSIEATDQVNLELAKMRIAARSMAMATNDEMWKHEAANFDSAKQSAEDGIAALDKLLQTDKGKAALKDIKSLYANYLSVAQGLKDATAKSRMTADPTISEALVKFNGPGAKASERVEDLQKIIDNAARARWENSNTIAAEVKTTLVSMLIGGVVLSIVLGFLISRGISVPLNKTSTMIDELMRGHLGMRLRMNREDEIGKMAKSMDTFADDLQNIVIGTMQKIANGDLSANIVPRDSQDEIGPALSQTIDALRGLIIEDGGKVLQAAADKDLSMRLTRIYKGEYAKMKDNINTVVQNLDNSMVQVSEAVGQVTGASSEISKGAQNLAEDSNKQASSLEEVSSSLEEMSSMTKQNAENSNKAKLLAAEARDAAQKGDESMKRMGEAIHQIKESSDNTAKIVKSIDDIAFQTNLLALNAAVEAARAGEAGKGFAVVAEEVRNLAMRSAEAAKNTADMIEESVKNADGGVKITEEVAKSLGQIIDRISKMNSLINEIAAASGEQAQGIEQVNKAVASMNQVTQSNAANSEESASAAEQLSSQAAELANMVSEFTLSVGQPRIGQIRQRNLPQAQRPRPVIAALPNKTTKAVKSVNANEIITLDGEELNEF